MQCLLGPEQLCQKEFAAVDAFMLPSFVRAMEFRRITETHCWVASRFQRQRMMPHMTQKKSFTIDYVIVSALDYVSLMGLL